MMGVADLDRMRFEPGLLVSFLPPLTVPLLSLRTPRLIPVGLAVTGDMSLIRAGDGMRDFLLDGEAIMVIMERDCDDVVVFCCGLCFLLLIITGILLLPFFLATSLHHQSPTPFFVASERGRSGTRYE
jgi:hypothetical protein